MDNSQIVLKLFLKQLNIDDDITTVDDRKRVQKAVYLGQLSGVDLGYRFGWYLMGPYCPSLTRDYFKLAEAINIGDEDYIDKSLKKEVAQKLTGIAGIMEQPEDIKLSQEKWLELIASIHYLRKVSGYEWEEVERRIRTAKSDLFEYFDIGKDALENFKLLN